jgi:site-specific recombinase XerD
MEVKFSYGKSNNQKAETQNVNIRVYHSNFDFRRSTNLEVSLRDWDFKNHRVKNAITGARSVDERKYILSVQEKLEDISKAFNREFLQLKLSNRLKSLSKEGWNEWCENTLNKALGKVGEDSEEAPLLIEKFNEYIQYLTLENSAYNTLKGYRSNLKVLQEFEKDTRHKYRTDETDLAFYNKLREWNKANGNNDNYFGSIIQKVKAVINHFRSLDKNFLFHPNIDHKKFKTIKISPEHDVLTEEELKRIFDYKGKESLENVRDLIILQYYSCSRYSELKSELKKGRDKLDIYFNDIEKKYFWRILEWKTGRKTKLEKNFPVHKLVLDLYHSANFPHLIAGQVYNRYLKELMSSCGIDKETTSHTIRRSFCTNMWNRGHDPQSIMQYSGHTTEKQLRDYIKTKNVVRFNSIPTE